MQAIEIQSYFMAEKAEALLFMLAGIMFIVVVFFALFIMRTSIWKGLAYPFMLIAFIQLAVGGTVYFRTDKQAEELSRLFQSNKFQFVQKELSRMEPVNAKFDMYKLIEIVLICLGIGLFFTMRNKNEFWYGIGIGLIIQCVLMLVFDLFAESRADVYTAFLKSL